MTDAIALRLYFPQSARIKPTRFWHHLSAPALSQHLVAAARRAGIEQVLLMAVHAGYLPGKKLSQQHPESTPAHHPLCLELVDTEVRLRKFLHDHVDELRHVRAVLFKCEIAI